MAFFFGFQFSAIANECVSIYTVNKIAAMILSEANGSKADTTQLIMSPHFSRIIVEQKRRDPNFIIKLKKVLNSERATVPIEPSPTRHRINKTSPVPTNDSKMPLNLGEFKYTVIPKNNELGFSIVELPNGEILALSAYLRGGGPEIVKFKPVAGADGNLTYEDSKTKHGYIDTRSSDPKLVSPNTIVIHNFYEESKQRMTFIDLNNLESTAFQHVPLEKYQSRIELLPLSPHQILVSLKDFGTFTIYDRTKGTSDVAFSKEYRYTPNNAKPNTSYLRTSQTELLPNGDLMIGYEIDHDRTYKGSSPKSFSMIQHWIRETDGTYKPGKDFDVAEYPDDSKNNFLRGGPKFMLVGMKALKNGVIMTAEEPGVLKTWKWDQSANELSLLASQKIFRENVEGVIVSLEVLADGQVLVNNECNENPSFPIISVDRNGKMTVTANLPSLASRYHILPLSHGGFYAKPNYRNQASLWTRKPL